MITADNMVRVGVVSAVDTTKHLARVIFPESADMVSGWLYVIKSIPETKSAGSHRHTSPDETNYAGGHKHDMDPWMPKVNDRVLCLLMVGTETDGYILGAIP